MATKQQPSNVSTTWLARLDTLATKYEKTMQWRLRELERLEGGLRTELGRAAALKSKLDAEISRFTEDLEELMDRKRDPVVFVRNYGSSRRVYHSNLYCGWIPYSYERLLWSEAQDRGLNPCSSCGGEADREARRIREESDVQKPKPV